MSAAHRSHPAAVTVGLLLTVLLFGCDRAAQQPAGSGDQADASGRAAGSELLLATPPDGWEETGAMQSEVLRMAEYGPAEAQDGRLERLTFEAQSSQPLPDPIAFVLAVSRDLEQRCKGFQDINVSSGYENGYPTSVRLMICPEFKDSPHGQVVMAKAIQGTEDFYVITRRLQVPPMAGQGQPLTAQEMAEWTTHLKRVQVCDTSLEGHPCPQAVRPDSSLPQ